MNFTIIINNYNYGRFLRQAIESCFEQDRNLLKEIIVVDDGSTDESRKIIGDFSNELIFTAIFQANSGQLSAMRSGVQASSGDILCFLDADDYFLRSDYLNILEDAYRKNHPDCIFIGQDTVQTGTNKHFKNREIRRRRMINRSYYLTRLGTVWLGQNTSTISMTSEMAKRIAGIPQSFDREWITRADNVFVFGVSILGGSKYFMPDKAVTYRIHGKNVFFGKAFTEEERNEHLMKNRKLCDYWLTQSDYGTSLHGFLGEAFSIANFSYLFRYFLILNQDEKFNVLERCLGNLVLLIPMTVLAPIKLTRRLIASIHILLRKGQD